MVEHVGTRVRRTLRRLPSPSARWHIVFGLVSLVTSVVLLATFLGVVPDRDDIERRGRVALAEALASSGSQLLRRGDLDGLRRSLEFVVERDADLLGVALHRDLDNSTVSFGRDDAATSAPANEVVLPLFRAGRRWGELRFGFADVAGASWLERARRSPFALMIFIACASVPLFWFYLGRVLKQLDPSEAVPSRVRSALDSIAGCLLVLDRRGDVVLANLAFSTLVGRSGESLLGRPVGSLAWVGGNGADRPWTRALEHGAATLRETVAFDAADGSRRSFLVNCTPITGARGSVGGVLVSMEDVTELEEKERLLTASMKVAEEANAAKTAFLSNMSHEIRTPMTAILGFTEVLLRGGAKSRRERERHLGTIADSGRHLLELINDLLDLSKVEAGAIDIERIATKPVSIVAEVVEVLGVKAREKGIELGLHIDTPAPEVIESDPAKLRQIVTNLVGNAIKFTDAGGVRVVLGWDTDAAMLRIDVEDSGIGMNEDQQTTVFDAFAQADASINRRFGGTGLGLSISRRLAEAMGGGITLASAPGEGSTFSVALPGGDVSSASLLSPEALLETLERDRVRPRTRWQLPALEVLVVDDGAENRELLSIVLGELGLEVALAANGEEAIAAVTAHDPALVLMDIQMPVMDGYEAAGRLRARGYDRPLIALTANAMKGFEQRVKDAGFSHYQTKPIDLERLSALLAELLGGRQVECETLEAEREAEASAPGGPSRESSECASIGSSLVAADPRFASIAVRFLERFATERERMRAAIADADHQELAALAHWLKGSGGTVGYDCLYEPALALEQAATAGDPDAMQRAMSTIDTIAKRLVVETVTDSDIPAAADTPDASVVVPADRNTGSTRRLILELSARMNTLEPDHDERTDIVAMAKALLVRHQDPDERKEAA